jgi:hypothetical protein
VVIGGGQEASQVTMSDRRAGKFEAKFFHKVFEEEIGGVKGHFGPINALAFNPDGRRCARLNFFLNTSIMDIGKKSSLQPMIHSSSSRWHLLVMSQSLQLSKT